MASSKTMVILETDDKQRFEVDAAVAELSELIKSMMSSDSEDEVCVDASSVGPASEVIPVKGVDAKIVSKVLEYMEKHKDIDPRISFLQQLVDERKEKEEKERKEKEREEEDDNYDEDEADGSDDDEQEEEEVEENNNDGEDGENDDEGEEEDDDDDEEEEEEEDEEEEEEVEEDEEERELNQLKQEIKAWDKEYINIDNDMLCHLLVAANYFNIKGLLNLTFDKAADQLKGKQPEKIREDFNIKNDFTPEEEEEIRSKISWVLDAKRIA